MISLCTPSAGRIIFRPLVVISLALVLLSFMPTLFHPVRASPPPFTFTAAGDYGGITPGSHGLTVAQKIALQNPSFHIALGDLGYGDQSPSAGIVGPWPDYSPGTTHYNWLKSTIDDAKNMGLWVAVALHKECLSDGIVHATCESTFDPFDLAITHHVDLWLEGHEHNYERSYQLTSCSGSGTTVTSCSDNMGTVQ